MMCIGELSMLMAPHHVRMYVCEWPCGYMAYWWPNVFHAPYRMAIESSFSLDCMSRCIRSGSAHVLPSARRFS